MKKASFLIILLMLAGSAWASSQTFDLIVDPVPEQPAGTLDAQLIQGNVPKGHDQTEEGAVATNHVSRSAFRVMYSLLDGLNLMAQLNVARPLGGSFDYAGTEFGAHFRLLEVGGWKLGGALEIEWQRQPQYVDNQLDIDFHPLIERDFGLVRILLNPTVEKNLVGPDAGKGLEFSYGAKVAYQWKRWCSPGVEFYGDVGKIDDTDPLRRQEHYIMPVVDAQLTDAWHLTAGAGVGMTRGSDQVITKFAMKYSVPDIGL